MADSRTGRPLSRRRLLAGTAATLATGGMGGAAPVRRAAAAAPRELRIAQWAHFVPAYDDWFIGKFARAWSEKNGVTVQVDRLSLTELRSRANAEVSTQQGHDVFGFVDPPAVFEAHAVPLTDVITDCERRLGPLARVAQVAARASGKSGGYYAFPDSWAPSVIHYRADWWGEAGVKPDSWEQIRQGGRRIREKHGVTAGFGLAPEPDSNILLRGLLWSFGGAEQDDGGRVALNSRATVEAVKLMTAIYQESMTSDVFMWDPSSNNRVFVWGRASIIENAISALRAMETHNPELAQKAALAPPPAGPQARLASPHVVHCYVVWKFSPQVELAKRFLADLAGAAEEAFRASEFYNLPGFTRAVPDLAKKLALPATARPRKPAGAGGAPTPAGAPDRYALLADADRWTVWPGYPGPYSAAIDEVVQRSVIPLMFARAARGDQSAEEAVRTAEVEMRRIFARWQK